jgi:hypothetical protein
MAGQLPRLHSTCIPNSITRSEMSTTVSWRTFYDGGYAAERAEWLASPVLERKMAVPFTRWG